MFGFLKRWILKRELRKWLERDEVRPMLTFLQAFLGGSKKATSVLAGLLIVIFREALGLDDETARELVRLIMVYIVGQGAVDVALSAKGSKKK